MLNFTIVSYSLRIRRVETALCHVIVTVDTALCHCVTVGTVSLLSALCHCVILGTVLLPSALCHCVTVGTVPLLSALCHYCQHCVIVWLSALCCCALCHCDGGLVLVCGFSWPGSQVWSVCRAVWWEPPRPVPASWRRPGPRWTTGTGRPVHSQVCLPHSVFPPLCVCVCVSELTASFSVCVIDSAVLLTSLCSMLCCGTRWPSGTVPDCRWFESHPRLLCTNANSACRPSRVG